MTSKERATLRSAANGLPVVYQIGKEDIDDTLIRGVGEALKARELIKINVQKSSMTSARAAADLLAKALKAEVVQVIGGKLVLYKHNREIGQYGVK